MNQPPKLVNQPVHLQTLPPWRFAHLRQRKLSSKSMKRILTEDRRTTTQEDKSRILSEDIFYTKNLKYSYEKYIYFTPLH